MFLLWMLLLSNLSQIRAKTNCTNENNPGLTYECSIDHECCPEGCCLKTFVVPKVSVALAINVCSFMLLLCFFCWCLQVFTRLWQSYHGRREVFEKVAGEAQRCRCEEAPPEYSVAVCLPGVEDAVPTYEEAALLEK